MFVIKLRSKCFSQSQYKTLIRRQITDIHYETNSSQNELQKYCLLKSCNFR